MRALVLERRGRYAIVLMPGGRFARIRAAHAVVGEEIEATSRGLAGRPLLRPYGYAAAALAVVLAVLPAALPPASAHVAAYATLDVNPSVQFGLSTAGQVVSAQGLDADGMTVISQSRPVGKSFGAAVSAILQAALKDGILPPGSDASIILATYPAGNAKGVPSAVEQQLLAARASGKAFLQSQHVQGIVTAMIVPGWLRAKARKAHVSPGVYAVAAALEGAGLQVDMKTLQGRGLGREIEKIAKTKAGAIVLPLLTDGRPVSLNQTRQQGAVAPSQSTSGNGTSPATTPAGKPHKGSGKQLIVLSPQGESPILGGSGLLVQPGQTSPSGKGGSHSDGSGKSEGQGHKSKGEDGTPGAHGSSVGNGHGKGNKKGQQTQDGSGLLQLAPNGSQSLGGATGTDGSPTSVLPGVGSWTYGSEGGDGGHVTQTGGGSDDGGD